MATAEYMRAYGEAKRKSRSDLVDEVIGAKCLFCESARRGTGGLVIHRTDGQPPQEVLFDGDGRVRE